MFRFPAFRQRTMTLSGLVAFVVLFTVPGVEFQSLGDTTKALNGGEGQRVIGPIGIGFSY